MPKVEVYQAENGEWCWRLKARNGQIICNPAETFVSKQNAKRNLRTVAKAFGKGINIVEVDA